MVQQVSYIQSSIQVQLLMNGTVVIVYSELYSGTVTDEWYSMYRIFRAPYQVQLLLNDTEGIVYSELHSDTVTDA
jgi:hypothetical protein